jgi:hypothetical protein
VGNEEREKIIRNRRSKAKSEAAAAALAQQHTRVSGRMGRMGVHHDQQHGQEHNVEMITAAEAVRAGTVAGGVDLFLPPSTYAMPMTLSGGRPFPAVAFTTAGYRQGGKSPPQDDGKAKSKAKSNRGLKLPSNSAPLNDMYKYETDLQKLWRIEKERVDQIFNKVYRDLAKATTTPQYSVNLAGSKSSKDSMIEYRAQFAMDSVIEEVKEIANAAHKAGTNAMLYFGNDGETSKVVNEGAENTGTSGGKENGSDAPDDGTEGRKDDTKEALIAKNAIPTASSDMSKGDHTKSTLTASKDEAASPSEKPSFVNPSEPEKDVILDPSLLLCDEDIEDIDAPDAGVATEKPSILERNETTHDDPVAAPVVELDASSLLCEEDIGSSEDRELTEDAVRELTVLATQEAALLRQLAGIIRRKTLEMTQHRLQLVEDARSKA